MCNRKIAGRTRTAEEGQKTHAVNVFYTEPLEQIPVLGNFPEINYTQVMAIDTQLSYARFVMLTTYRLYCY